MSDAQPSFKAALLAALPSLRAFALSLSGRADVADDLVQETVMKAWAKQADFRLGTNIQAWLVTILRNTFYSQMRKRGREVQDSEGIRHGGEHTAAPWRGLDGVATAPNMGPLRAQATRIDRCTSASDAAPRSAATSASGPGWPRSPVARS